jgi:hypothetical protein
VARLFPPDDYRSGIDMCLPFRHVRSLDPARNLWRRAGLADVTAEELRWIDQVGQSQMPDDQRAIYKDHTWYLVEGIRPNGRWSGRPVRSPPIVCFQAGRIPKSPYEVRVFVCAADH